MTVWRSSTRPENPISRRSGRLTRKTVSERPTSLLIIWRWPKPSGKPITSSAAPGATTCAELIASSKPSLLVPFAGRVRKSSGAQRPGNGENGRRRRRSGKGFHRNAEFAARIIGLCDSRDFLGRMREGLAAPPDGRDGGPDRGCLLPDDGGGEIGERNMVKRGYKKLKHIHMVGIGGTGNERDRGSSPQSRLPGHRIRHPGERSHSSPDSSRRPGSPSATRRRTSPTPTSSSSPRP